MGHPSLKKRSKRMSCRTRYKIDKKVREHNRKKRREDKKTRKGPKSNLVLAPNLCPFKEQAIEDLNKAKLQEKELHIENLKALKENVEESSISMQNLINNANIRNHGYDMLGDLNTNINNETKKTVKCESVTLAKEFKKVVAVADVILEVVDARDPLGTRCKIVEETVLKYPRKRLVIVVNKADLVPRDILERWLTYLRGKWPAVPFKASVQQQSRKLGRRAMIKKSNKKKHLQKLMAVSSCVGGEFLMKILANYRRNKGIDTSITVGVVGMPNVGKSSIINSLKRSKSCRVGAEPGVTRNMQTVQVGAFIKILDSPGIVLEPPEIENKSMLALKNVLRADRMQDPLEAANAILNRATKQQMKELYHIDDYSRGEEFLYSLAKRFCILGKKGIPDTFKAAKTLVSDWNRGKIRYYTLVPELNADTHVSSTIITEMTKEFDIDAFQPEETILLNAIDEGINNRALYFKVSNEPSSAPEAMKVIEGNNNKTTNVVVDTTIATKKSGKLRWRKKNKKDVADNTSLPQGVSNVKKLQKLNAKKKRKKDGRIVREQTKILDTNSMSL